MSPVCTAGARPAPTGNSGRIGRVMRRHMKVRLLAIGAVVFGAGAILGAAELVEKVVVRVNDRLITNSELQRRIVAASHAPRASTDVHTIKNEGPRHTI